MNLCVEWYHTGCADQSSAKPTVSHMRHALIVLMKFPVIEVYGITLLAYPMKQQMPHTH